MMRWWWPYEFVRMPVVKRMAGVLLPLFLILRLSVGDAAAEAISGTVVDVATGGAIAGAIIVAGDQQTNSDAVGHFSLSSEVQELSVRALGYRRQMVRLAGNGQLTIALTQLHPKALYLSTYGIGSTVLREAALDVIRTGGLNAVVIDLKGDSGLIPYPSAIRLAAADGALRIQTVHDLHKLVAELQTQGLYTIARIVVFRDNLLASARPDWAVHRPDGKVWQDTMGQAWIDPFRREAWDYAIGVAMEAAASGFDEIQFDYVRFPDTLGLRFAEASTEESRIAAIMGFLTRARERLRRYNVFLAADIFGYVCWNRNDTFIGQKLEEIAAQVDYISPMLYPSGFQFGIPGYRNPVADPYAIVFNSLKTATERVKGYPVRFRPWLQAFRDYAFDRRPFGAAEVGAQIKAAEDAGAVGWMLWNPRNVYSADGLMSVQSNASQ